MDQCDVLIVGGGPAGSTCAWKLRQAGADVVVMDKAAFPRDKVCAGWITPQVVRHLALDLDEYARSSTLQRISGFRTGVIGGDRAVRTAYDAPVSFGIRRCEFDDYLLRRSRARLLLGEPATSLERAGAAWIVNGRLKASLIVGAGGHFCPVARLLNGGVDGPVVAAQEAEPRIEHGMLNACSIDGDTPELYFSRDLKGYGWCVRKGDYLNVGFGSLDRHACRSATDAFLSFLKARGKIPVGSTWRWRGHAYLLSEPHVRRVVDDGALLIGDAAGLAYPKSGEGIGPAIESGLIAAAAILDARGLHSAERLQRYGERLRDRFSLSSTLPLATGILPAPITSALGVALLRVPWFVRRIVLDRWFLRLAEPAASA